MIHKTSVYASLIFILLAVLISAPYWTSDYWLKMLINMTWIIYLACAWHLLLRGSLFSMMHGLFLGAGAYTSTLLWLHFGVSPWLGMLAGVALSVVLALPTGWLILRGAISFVAFAAMTLAFAMIAVFLVSSVTSIGGSRGLSMTPPLTDDPWNYQWASPAPYYYIILALAVCVVILTYFVMKSRLGLRLRASARNSRLASISGVNLLSSRMTVFVISAVLFSIAGTFWAQYTHVVRAMPLIGPETIVPVSLMVYIGGAGTTWGPVVGPALMIPLVWWARREYGSQFPGIEMLIYGVVLLLILRFIGVGILLWPKRYRAWRGARAAAKHGGERTVEIQAVIGAQPGVIPNPVDGGPKDDEATR